MAADNVSELLVFRVQLQGVSSSSLHGDPYTLSILTFTYIIHTDTHRNTFENKKYRPGKLIRSFKSSVWEVKAIGFLGIEASMVYIGSSKQVRAVQ